MKSAFLASSFSTALLATALRQRILSRLRFACVVSTIIKLLPEIFMLADKNFDQRSLSTISSQLSSISATVKHYNTLWFSLSATFLRFTLKFGKKELFVLVVFQTAIVLQNLLQLLNHFSKAVYHFLTIVLHLLTKIWMRFTLTMDRNIKQVLSLANLLPML